MFWLVFLVVVVLLVLLLRSRLYQYWWERKYYHFRQTGRWGAVRTIRAPKKGHASVHKVISVNRDQANIFLGGIGAFESIDIENDITVDELMKDERLSLYSAHEPQKLYIFFTTTEEFWKHPFHGMGHRGCLPLGANVYFLSFEDANEWVKKNCSDVSSSDFLFVWNTSRCGSTLMTRILDKCNAPSLSEPHFLDTIYDLIRLDKDISEEEVCQRFKTSLLLERQLVKNQYPNYEKLSIKPRMGVKLLAEAKKVFPDSKHFLVYRDVGPVAESLASIGLKHIRHLSFCGFNPTMALLNVILTVQYPPRKPSYDKLYDHSYLGFGMYFANVMTVEWVDFVKYWLKESAKLDDCLTLRFEELISKDRNYLGQMLTFFGFDESYVDLALKGYDKHSQAGHFSQDSSSRTGERYMTKKQQNRLCEIARSMDIPNVLPHSIGHFKNNRK